MNTKDLIRLGVPLGEATRRATDFISKFILKRRRQNPPRRGSESHHRQPFHLQGR